MIAIDVLGVRISVVMEKHDVQVITLHFVQIDELGGELEVEVIELHEVSRKEELRELFAKGQLLAAPCQHVFRVVAMSAGHGQLVELVVALLFGHHLFQIVAEQLVFVHTFGTGRTDASRIDVGRKVLVSVGTEGYVVVIGIHAILLQIVEFQSEVIVVTVGRHARLVPCVRLLSLEGRAEVLGIAHHRHRDVAYEGTSFQRRFLVGM